MTRVKICGITDQEHALGAAEAGADILGMVFAASKRQITEEKACEIASALRLLRGRPLVAGVFVNRPEQEVNRIAEACRLDWVQLSGHEDWDYCRHIARPIIKAIHVHPGATARDVLDTALQGYRILGRDRLIYLLDTGMKDMYGGTGVKFNWEIAREIIVRYPVIIAGGLNAENVGRLIAGYGPWGVDVSTGVEHNGRKDIGRMEAFIRAVRCEDKEEK